VANIYFLQSSRFSGYPDILSTTNMQAMSLFLVKISKYRLLMKREMSCIEGLKECWHRKCKNIPVSQKKKKTKSVATEIELALLRYALASLIWLWCSQFSNILKSWHFSRIASYPLHICRPKPGNVFDQKHEFAYSKYYFIKSWPLLYCTCHVKLMWICILTCNNNCLKQVNSI
jgi:hypothetical protein